jgi:hypothetical protein
LLLARASASCACKTGSRVDKAVCKGERDISVCVYHALPAPELQKMI